MNAKTPPMGWNSWDCYGPAVDERTVRENARIMAEKLKPFGWEYIVVDIQWAQPAAGSFVYDLFSDLEMDGNGRLIPAVNRFPGAADGQGFKPLADYVHQLGLKFGIHIMRGMPRMAAHRDLPITGSPYTARQAADPYSICKWNPDMYGLRCSEPAAKAYYDSIFRLYASWGVDFIKVDDIAREYPHCREEIELISSACRGCGRNMVLSLSPGPAPLEEAEHLKRFCNMWRITDDFWDSWSLLLRMFERAEKWCVHAGPGHWPDADMLPLGALRRNEDMEGWTRFTKPEQVCMMTLWCIMRSPLFLGCDLQYLDDFTLWLITNPDVLDVPQKSHCARPLYRSDREAAWLASCRDTGDLYVALFNLSDETRQVVFDTAVLEIPGHFAWKELWGGETGLAKESLISGIPAHGAKLFLVSRP